MKKKNIFLCMLLAFGCTLHARAQIITTFAGTGTFGFSGDGGPAINAQYSSGSLSFDSSGNLYLADPFNNRVRIINTGNIINTYAGTGIAGVSGDGFSATAAYLDTPGVIATDVHGNLYILDQHNPKIRKVATSGIITTFAGTGIQGYSGDGGQATSAQLDILYAALTTDAAGNVYFGDYWNIRKVDLSGVITTVAGNSSYGFSGDGGPATIAQLDVPGGFVTDASGNLYFADNNNHRIRKIDTFGIVTTIAGSGPTGGSGGFSGDGGPATAARFRYPSRLAIDHAENIYIMDAFNHRIRKIDTAGIITTVAGTGTAGTSGDGGPATAAEINFGDIAADCAGNLYINDSNRIRIIMFDHPVFMRGHTQSITLCENGAPTAIDSLLKVTGTNTGLVQTWSMIAPPAHGTAVGSYTTTSTGDTLVTTGLSYTPASGYTGNDTFKIQVSDCGHARDTTTLYVTVVNCALKAPPGLPWEQAVLSVLPNPNEGSFTFSLSAGIDESVQVVITNMVGEKVKEFTTTTNKTTNIQLDAPAGFTFFLLPQRREGGVRRSWWPDSLLKEYAWNNLC